jgi:uncharacterized membrane protein (UPF0182 family)
VTPNPGPNKTPAWLKAVRVAVLALIVIAVLFGYPLVRLYTDWLWFGEMRHPGVYGRILGARVLLFFGFGLLFFLLAYFNLWLALRFNAARPRARLMDLDREQFSRTARRAMGWLALGGSVFLAFLVGGNAATHWSDYLLFTHAGSFGQADPVFGNDIGFYVFRLPFLNFLQGWFLFTLGLTIVATGAVYFSDRQLDILTGATPLVSTYVRRHLLALLGTFALVFAWGSLLGRYDLLFNDNGPYVGAGYADLHARMPGIYIQVFFMLLVAALCFFNIWRGRPFRLPVAGLAIWAVAWLLVLGVYPGFVQRFQVVPNQFAAEKPYIARDIKFTRMAYGLDGVEEKSFSGTTELTGADLAANKPTIDNIRLWDWPQLGAVYANKQAFRRYYRFSLPEGMATNNGSDFNIDVDRYRLGSDYRQVMLAARELYADGLPAEAQTWVNRRLQYTHGYGAVMSPVNRVDKEGLPEYYLSEMPVLAARPELKVDRPQVYYGELEQDYVFVNTRQAEFDYPAGEGGSLKEFRYDGKGGLPLSGTLSRLAWSLRLGDANMLLSSDLTDKSRILFRRGIRERVQALAPFLNWDNDPYLVVYGGRLVWMMDAYTVSDHYPYSRPFSAGTGMADVEQEFNYLRNAVKAVVDSYDGTVTLYVANEKDPIIRTWGRVFPGLLTPIEKMPAELRAHIRYPEDLFRIQRNMWATYHVTDPGTLYRKEDQWAVPQDPTPPTDSEGNPIASSSPYMMPYYVIMRLPGEKEEEFMMMTPFTPQANPNLAAWMCAKCDGEDYGKLLVYRFPKGSTVNGPQQIMAQVKAQREISETQTLLGQRGSKVIFGNLLIIPIESSLLYAIPLYVQASGENTIPEINQVILATGNRIVMRPTLETAIAALSGGQAVAEDTGTRGRGDAGTIPAPSQAPASVPELVRRASAAYEKARRTQQEYNRSLDDLGRTLQELQKQLGK